MEVENWMAEIDCLTAVPNDVREALEREFAYFDLDYDHIIVEKWLESLPDLPEETNDAKIAEVVSGPPPLTLQDVYRDLDQRLASVERRISRLETSHVD